MKKWLRLFCTALVCCALAGCVRIEMPDPEPQTAYASFYPVYVLAEGICRGVPNLSLGCIAQPQDGCIRSYTLSDRDAALLSGADLIILGGRGLESYESALSAGEIPVVSAMDSMPLVQNGEAQEDDHFTGDNPWYFLSIDGARDICSVIAGAMAQLDPDFADLYTQNLERMLDQFESLRAQTDALMQGREIPGAILMQEGLRYFAADMGVGEFVEIHREAGSDMSEAELEEALAIMRESGHDVVLIERQAPQGLVEALDEAGYTVVKIDILTDHSAAEPSDTYFSAMLSNAQAFASALEG